MKRRSIVIDSQKLTAEKTSLTSKLSITLRNYRVIRRDAMLRVLVEKVTGQNASLRKYIAGTAFQKF